MHGQKSKGGKQGKGGTSAPSGKGGKGAKKGNQTAVAESESSESETDDAEATTDDPLPEGKIELSAFTGVFSPTNLESRFDKKVEEAQEAMGEAKVAVNSIVSKKAVAAARLELVTVQTKLTEVDKVVDAITTTNHQLKLITGERDPEEDEAEADETSGGDELIELSTEFDKLVPKVLSTQHTLTEDLTDQTGKVGLAEDDLTQSAGAVAALNALRGRWASASLAKGHFTKHQGDTGTANETEYLTKAAALNDAATSADVVRKVRGDGDTLTMRKSTKEFTILSTAGKIRTYFCPGDGIKYFNRQT